jgi:predicted RNA-binding protein with PUA-like domain
MNYWLLKSEPGAFSWDDLAAAPGQTTAWDGVRNYQARNLLRDRIRLGDQAFFYHSSTAVPGIVGIVQVVGDAYPDGSALDPASPYFDPTSDPARPRWYSVDVKLLRPLRRFIALRELKARHDALGDFPLLRRGNRLSVIPVAADQWRAILNLEG